MNLVNCNNKVELFLFKRLPCQFPAFDTNSLPGIGNILWLVYFFVSACNEFFFKYIFMNEKLFPTSYCSE